MLRPDSARRPAHTAPLQDAHELFVALLEGVQREVLAREVARLGRSRVRVSETSDPAARNFSLAVSTGGHARGTTSTEWGCLQLHPWHESAVWAALPCAAGCNAQSAPPGRGTAGLVSNPCGQLPASVRVPCCPVST